MVFPPGICAGARKDVPAFLNQADTEFHFTLHELTAFYEQNMNKSLFLIPIFGSVVACHGYQHIYCLELEVHMGVAELPF